MVPWNKGNFRAVSKVLFPTSQWNGEEEDSMANVDHGQFAILCPIILSTGAPLYPSGVDSKLQAKIKDEKRSKQHKVLWF